MRHLVALGVLASLALAGPATASTIAFRTNAQLVATSSRIVLARVIGQRVVRDADPDGTVHTVTRLAVLEDFTGFPAGEIEVWELGGCADGECLKVEGAVTFSQGGDVVLLLEQGPHGLRPVAMSYGAFHVQVGTDGSRQLVRDLRGTFVQGGQPVDLSLDSFRALVAQVKKTQPVMRDAALPALSNEAAFTLLPFGPPRWAQADSGIPINVYRNANTPVPLLVGDGVAEFGVAMAAWNNPPNASIVLQYAGTTPQANPRGPFVGLTGTQVVVTFDDPNNELAAGTVAIAGGVYSPGTGGNINGVAFHGFSRAYVIFGKTASLDPSFRQPLDFTRVLTHELGHTIGLGHTQTDGSVPNPTSNIMYSTCCAVSAPVPPALGPDDLAGLAFIYPLVTTTVTLDKERLNYGATMSGTDFIAQTTAQIVRMTQTGPGTVTWTATSSVPWLQVSPAAGTGPQPVSMTVSTVAGLPLPGTVSGTVTINFSGALPAQRIVAVNLTTIVNGTSTQPIGVVDTPMDGTTGITGAIPVTGWTLDDTEVASVAICRDPAGGEPSVPDARCKGNAQYFLGYAVFVDGARPDVDIAYPSLPRSTRGGYGFMVLTNMLPLQGNGTYRFSAYALDREGFVTHLGTKTVSCTNATATKPFGTIDTPYQGEVIAGNSFVNFGWALTQQPKFIPADGSTMSVVVDGVVLGKPNYGFYRSDIATYFPGLANSDGAIGYYVLDTTALANGIHTIVWNATDSGGNSDGLGSRFFNVANAFASAVKTLGTVEEVPARELKMAEVEGLPLDGSSLQGRRGWNLQAPLRQFEADTTGLVVVRGEELDRFEIHLPAVAGGNFRGFHRVGQQLRPLPAGSALDAASGVFTWAPGAGFLGAYQLVFVESIGTDAVSRRDVRVVITPKGSIVDGPQVVIDTPTRQQDVGQPFTLAGWAADFGAERGSGIDAIHVWAYPLRGGAPVFVGTATIGGARPDVAALHGQQFRDSGYGLTVQGLEHGNYDLAVFGHSSVTGDFVPATVVRVTVR